MKINKIHINAFGKLTNFDIEFSDGLNLIYGDNEFGKSTLMAFIKMIFFGTAGGKAGVDRKKYIPWGGGKYAGSIDFTKDGVSYRIEREFAATNSHDKIKIINLNSSTVNEVSPKENLGEKLFGCSLACFERTLFIGALSDNETESTVLGEINKKLANIVTSGDEDVSATTVSKNLLDAKHRLLSKGGKIGVCDKAKLKADELKNTLLNERLEYAEKQRRLSELDELKEQIEVLNSREATLKAQLKTAQSYLKGATLKEFVSCSNEVIELKEKLTCKDGNLLTQKDIFALKEKQAEIDATKKAIEQKSAFDDSEGSLSAADGEMGEKTSELSMTAKSLQNEITRKEGLAEDLGKKTRLSVSPLAVIFCIFAVLAVFLGLFLQNHLSMPLYLIGTALLICFIIMLILSAKKAKSAQSSYMSLREEILRDKEKLQEINSEISAVTQANKQQTELKLFAIRQREKELSELKEDLKKQQSDYQKFFDTLPEVHGFDYNEKIQLLSELLIKLSAAESKADILRESLNGISLSLAQKALEELGEPPESLPDAQTAEKEIDNLQKEIQKLTEEYHRQENFVSVKYHHLHIPAAVERELNELQAEIERQEEFCTALDLALQVLEEASDEMQSSWGGELNDRVSEIFSRITGEKYSDVLVSKNLSLSAEENNSFGLKSVENLSAGTKDQSYFALRLALCDLIFGQNNTFPLFLDDSFERYDDLRAKRALEFLKEFSSKNQVLLFTCHKNLEGLI